MLLNVSVDYVVAESSKFFLGATFWNSSTILGDILPSCTLKTHIFNSFPLFLQNLEILTPNCVCFLFSGEAKFRTTIPNVKSLLHTLEKPMRKVDELEPVLVHELKIMMITRMLFGTLIASIRESKCRQ